MRSGYVRPLYLMCWSVSVAGDICLTQEVSIESISESRDLEGMFSVGRVGCESCSSRHWFWFWWGRVVGWEDYRYIVAFWPGCLKFVCSYRELRNVVAEVRLDSCDIF